jgi:hypothetical protein
MHSNAAKSILQRTAINYDSDTFNKKELVLNKFEAAYLNRHNGNSLELLSGTLKALEEERQGKRWHPAPLDVMPDQRIIEMGRFSKELYDIYARSWTLKLFVKDKHQGLDQNTEVLSREGNRFMHKDQSKSVISF